MKNNILKKSVSALMALCMILSVSMLTVCAYESNQDITTVNSDGDIMPYTMYLMGGSITYQKPSSGGMRVQVKTNANSKVASLYQDIVIYKNGTEVYRGRKYGSNATSLLTHEDISAKKGDFFSTYVVHYVSHNGYVEYFEDHADQTF